MARSMGVSVESEERGTPKKVVVVVTCCADLCCGMNTLYVLYTLEYFWTRRTALSPLNALGRSFGSHSSSTRASIGREDAAAMAMVKEGARAGMWVNHPRNGGCGPPEGGPLAG